jgi:hypothetical protein
VIPDSCFVRALLGFPARLFPSGISLQLEMLALRHLLRLDPRSLLRPHLRPSHRILWSWLTRCWARRREILVFVQPATVLAWQPTRFREHWARPSQTGWAGRPTIVRELRELIREISAANRRWASPRILGELRELGITVAKSTGGIYRVRPRRPVSPPWQAFVRIQMAELVALDFFIGPPIRFKVLSLLIMLAHERRTIVDFNGDSLAAALGCRDSRSACRRRGGGRQKLAGPTNPDALSA